VGIGTSSPTAALHVAASTSYESAKLPNAAEATATSATAATGTVNFYVASGAVQYYTASASGNWILNWAWSASTSMNTAMAVGDSVTTAFLVTQGATAYYPSAYKIDGTSVTPKWQGGTAPSAGNASGIDVYTCSIIKTASATYTVLCSQSQFK
jgi:hypothetical protein